MCNKDHRKLKSGKGFLLIEWIKNGDVHTTVFPRMILATGSEVLTQQSKINGYKLTPVRKDALKYKMTPG